MKYHPQIKLFALLLLLGFVSSCVRDRDPELEKKYPVGGLYSVMGQGAEFNVVKVLAITRGTVHVRIYKNKFVTRDDAAKVETSKLSLGSIDDPEGFGLKFLPMDKTTFENMAPTFIRQETVTDEELQGFKDWKASTASG